MTMARRNTIAGLALMAFGVWYAYLIGNLPERSIMPNTPGPSFFPIIIVSVVLLLSAALLATGIIGLRQRGNDADANSLKQPALLTVGVFIVYLASLPYAGFIIASVLFFAAMMYLYGSRNWLMIAVSSTIIPTVLFVLFRYGFQIILPRGILAF